MSENTKEQDEQEAIVQFLKKLDVTRDDLGFEKKIILEKNDIRERQRKAWKVILDDLKMISKKKFTRLPIEYSPVFANRSMHVEVHDIRRKKKKEKTAYTGELKPRFPFNRFRVETVLKRTIGKFCETMKKFHKNDSQWIAKSLASLILHKVHKLKYDRHKLIVTVRLYEEKEQYKKVSMTYMWDCDFDGHCHFQQSGPGYVVVASVLALYIE
ncbi:hypothetical protein O3M35_001410 [Rhynocoris fuscipes]|uniref:Uncharacterized protein n=1 Tax=Rhynocoris fuscipes TaxID=488301 RepID=A0AAW1CNU9_9HEMI